MASVTLQWADNSDGEAGFRVQQRDADGQPWTTIHTTPANAQSYQVTGLPNSATRTFRVGAVRGGLALYSEPVTVTTAPAAPVLAVTAIGYELIRLDWTCATGDEDGFAIEHSLDGEDWSELDTAGAGVYEYQHEVAHDTTHYYRVRATRGEVVSAWSNAASASTPFSPEIYASDNGGVMKGWIDADDLAQLFQDAAGTVPVTGASQPIGRINDKIAGAPYFWQGTTSVKPTFNGDGAWFDGGDLLESSDRPYWKFLHDGTRAVVLVHIHIDGENPANFQYVLNSGGHTGSRVGYALAFSDSAVNNGLYVGITNGAAQQVAGPIHQANVWEPDGWRVIATRYENGLAGNDLAAWVDGTPAASAESINQPQNSNPTDFMRIGRSSEGGAGWLTATVRRVWVFTGLADDAMATLVQKIAA